ncbi:hypothetical protein DAPPUDRAFT_330570 [Daphnia pulex]|uniref:Uncharacterized protein n=1 Tax=Daphnia pulex TaxID=6669 RepID=E9HJZ0_DAPPU|nr:hypothetical protein DAPPUDRAFT_330570 [Daphnia pulex]|eukprot:EFX67956.1 hypothetical protein DAPPUDRAFT_330570 [Daphnia pulex]
MSKEEREAAINQKIEEIRRKNATITQRYQEIENDKKNAENFSLVATQRMKTRSVTGNDVDDNSPTMKQPAAARPEKSEMNREPKEPRKIKKKHSVSDLAATTDFRPQRLTENDLPPPDPVFSYLTDRLREGAFCAPISPAANRRHSTSSQSSEMSIGSSSRSNNSRRTSTTSNSSWTSDTSSKYDGFSNYQPPRRYSVCRDYVRNRRLSEQLNTSDEKEDEQWNYNKQGQFQQNNKDFKKSFQSNTAARDRETGKVTWVSSDVSESQISEITGGSTLQPWKREISVTNSRSEYVTNWRDRHIGYTTTAETDFTSIDEGVAQLAVSVEDPNNNNDMINHNMPIE